MQANQALAKTLREGAYSSPFQMLLNKDGRRELFVRGTGSLGLYHAWETYPGSSDWSPWEYMGGVLPHGFKATYMHDGGKRIIHRGTTGLVYLKDEIPGDGWTDFYPIGYG